MHRLQYIISICLYLFTSITFSQILVDKEVVRDSVIHKTGYGLRIGVDISKPIRSFINKDYKALEFVADYRISKKWYVATEFGYDEKDINEEFLNVTSSGKFIRLGVNYNTYNNWLDMNNEIYIGSRYGVSLYNQTLNSFMPNVNSDYFPSKSISKVIEMNSLNIHWVEFQLGIKVETFKNLFIGFHGSYKVSLYNKDPEGFKAFYASGFNRIYTSKTGFGFNYTISYLIPFTKK